MDRLACRNDSVQLDNHFKYMSAGQPDIPGSKLKLCDWGINNTCIDNKLTDAQKTNEDGV